MAVLKGNFFVEIKKTKWGQALKMWADGSCVCERVDERGRGAGLAAFLIPFPLLNHVCTTRSDFRGLTTMLRLLCATGHLLYEAVFQKSFKVVLHSSFLVQKLPLEQGWL